jgi:hypothetical protein
MLDLVLFTIICIPIAVMLVDAYVATEKSAKAWEHLAKVIDKEILKLEGKTNV